MEDEQNDLAQIKAMKRNNTQTLDVPRTLCSQMFEWIAIYSDLPGINQRCDSIGLFRILCVNHAAQAIYCKREETRISCQILYSTTGAQGSFVAIHNVTLTRVVGQSDGFVLTSIEFRHCDYRSKCLFGIY